MKISIESNIKRFIQGLKAFENKDIPYATMVATNNLAFDAMRAIRREVATKLHIRRKSIPTAWRVKKATKQRPYAVLYVDEWSWQYKALRHHYTGGDRARKGMEKAMIRLGYMHPQEILTPPPGVYIQPHTYVEMMSQLKLNYKAGFMANETKASRKRRERLRGKGVRYFIITGRNPSPMAPGVYARVPGIDHPVCMLRIAEKPEYQKRLHDKQIVESIYRLKGKQYFEDAMARALAIRKAKGWG